MKKTNPNINTPRGLILKMYQRSNVLHERHDDNLEIHEPLLIGGRWVPNDRGRRLFPEEPIPPIDEITQLLHQENERARRRWNFNFISEKVRREGDWEWNPRTHPVRPYRLGPVVGAEVEQESDEDEGHQEDIEDDEDDEDLQEVAQAPVDSDDSDGSPHPKRLRMISTDRV